MSEVVGAVIGAIAVVCIPLAAWFSRRATREGRLLLRVERLGSVFALIPDSTEKDTFELHVIGAVADLNSWLDADNAKRRKLIRTINRWTYGIGVLAVFIALPSIDTSANPWQSSVLGTVIGLSIAGVTMGASFLLERSARAKSALAAKAREDAAAALRMEALRQGEPMPMAQPLKKRP
jgi:hypothetical protein